MKLLFCNMYKLYKSYFIFFVIFAKFVIFGFCIFLDFYLYTRIRVGLLILSLSRGFSQSLPQAIRKAFRKEVFMNVLHHSSFMSRTTRRLAGVARQGHGRENDMKWHERHEIDVTKNMNDMNDMTQHG